MNRYQDDPDYIDICDLETAKKLLFAPGADEEMEQTERLQELLPNEPGSDVTPEQIKRFQDGLDNACKALNRKRRIVKWKRAGILVAAIAVVLSMMLMSVDAVRFAVFDFFHVRTDRAFTYGFTTVDRGDQRFAPTEIPDAGLIQYEYAVDDADGTVQIYYATPDRSYAIKIYMFPIGQHSNIDGEDLGIEETVKIGDYSGKLTAKGERITLIWEVPEMSFTCYLNTNFPKAEAIEIAKNINFDK